MATQTNKKRPYDDRLKKLSQKGKEKEPIKEDRTHQFKVNVDATDKEAEIIKIHKEELSHYTNKGKKIFIKDVLRLSMLQLGNQKFLNFLGYLELQRK